MKTVKVLEVCQQTPLQSLVVRRDVSLGWVINEFAHSHDLHGIFLIDEQEQVAGVLNSQDLLQWAQIHLDLPLPVTSVTLGQVRRLVQARQAQDLARPGSEGAAVRENDTLDTALKRMARYGLTAIPVVDGQGRVINDLRLSEILAFALEAADISRD